MIPGAGALAVEALWTVGPWSAGARRRPMVSDPHRRPVVGGHAASAHAQRARVVGSPGLTPAFVGARDGSQARARLHSSIHVRVVSSRDESPDAASGVR